MRAVTCVQMLEFARGRPLSEVIELNLVVDGLTPGYRGERFYPISALAAQFGRSLTIAHVLR